MKQHKFIGLLIASLSFFLVLLACDPDEKLDNNPGGIGSGITDNAEPTNPAITASGAVNDAVIINQASNTTFTITGADNVGVSHYFVIAVDEGATVPSKPQASATKTSGNSGWVAVPGNTPKALSETINLDGHTDLLPTNGDSKDLYVFLKDAADNVSNASNKLAIIVDATALILAFDELTKGYYTYFHGSGNSRRYYLAIIGPSAWDYFNENQVVANGNKITAPVGARVAAYDQAGSSATAALTSGHLADDNVIRVTNGKGNTREYIVKIRAAAPKVKVHASANDRLFIGGNGTDSAQIVFGSAFNGKVQYQQKARGESASKRPGYYTDAPTSPAALPSLAVGEQFFLNTKHSGTNPASMPTAEIVVSAAPAWGNGTGKTYQLTATASTAVNVKATASYEYQFATSAAGAGAASWTAGTDSAVLNTLASVSPSNARYIRLRLKSTASVAGLTTTWIGVVAPAAPASGARAQYVLSEGNKAAGNVMLQLDAGYEYRLGATNWKDWVTPANIKANNVDANTCETGSTTPCTKIEIRKKEITTGANKAVHGIVKAIGTGDSPTFASYKTTPPTIASMEMANGGESSKMGNGDTITIVFSEAMDIAAMGTEYFIEAKHTGSRVVKIYKGSAAIPANLIADFSTEPIFASINSSITFTGTDMGAWSNSNKTLTLTLAGQSGSGTPSGIIDLVDARIQPGSVDSVGNAATANIKTTDNSGNPRGNF